MKFNNWSLCCISKTLSDSKQNFQTMTLSRFNAMPRESAMNELCKRILHNIVHTHRTIRFCQDHNILGYRVSSSLFPIISHSSVNLKICELPVFSQILTEIESIKKTLSRFPVKLSAHPSEYISLSTDDPDILRNTFADLQQHAEFFDLLGLPCDYNAPLNIHVRKDGDKETIKSNVMRNYEKLPDNVRNRLVLENNDNRNGVWSVKNLVECFFKNYNIPITFDYLHHSLLSDGLGEEEAFTLCRESWRDYTPVFHYSEGIPLSNGEISKAHKDMPETCPCIYDKKVYLDVELKHKDLAIKKLQSF